MSAAFTSSSADTPRTRAMAASWSPCEMRSFWSSRPRPFLTAPTPFSTDAAFRFQNNTE